VPELTLEIDVAKVVVEKEVNDDVYDTKNENVVITEAMATNAIGTEPQTDVLVDQGMDTKEFVLTDENIEKVVDEEMEDFQTFPSYPSSLSPFQHTLFIVWINFQLLML